jgi:hypothetical protein
MWHLGIHSKIGQSNHLHLNLSYRDSLALYLTNTIKSFALSIAGLYVPIFIYVSFKDNLLISSSSTLNGIYFILAFYLVRSLCTLVFMHKIVNFIFGWVNFKLSIFISNLLLALAIYLLVASEKQLYFLFIAAVIFSVETLLYWIPFHTNFIRVLKINAPAKMGSSTGMRFFLASLASAAGPALGGLIIKIYGFDTLFLITTALLIISALPVLFGTHEHKHGKHNLFHIIKKYTTGNNYKLNIIAHMAAGIDGNLYAIFAPLLLFIIADENTSNVGIVISVAVFLAAIFTLVAGKLADTNTGNKIKKISTLFNSLLYIPRIFIGTPGILYIVDIFDKINGSFLSVPLMCAAYDQATNEENETDYMIYREFFIHLGTVVGIIIFGIMLSLFDNWRLIFAVLALVSPFTYLIYINRKN